MPVTVRFPDVPFMLTVVPPVAPPTVIAPVATPPACCTRPVVPLWSMPAIVESAVVLVATAVVRFAMAVPCWVTAVVIPATVTLVAATAVFVAFSCEPFTASVELVVIVPAATPVKVRLPAPPAILTLEPGAPAPIVMFPDAASCRTIPTCPEATLTSSADKPPCTVA